LKSREDAPDERPLIVAAQRDPSRFAELYEANFERVYAFISRRVRDRSEAQDLTSDVFHQALANIGRFEWRGVPFASWLFRIAANAIADHYTLRSREQNTPGPEQVQAVDFAGGLDEVERRARLFRLVNQLPKEQRQVILMRFSEERSIREIADELGKTDGAVKQLQFRALQTLRTRLRDFNG
jgi:RNA polymerase sigma-70 factor (ECF subfamily)